MSYPTTVLQPIIDERCYVWQHRGKCNGWGLWIYSRLRLICTQNIRGIFVRIIQIFQLSSDRKLYELTIFP